MPLLRLALAMTLSLFAGAAFAEDARTGVVRATVESVSADGANLAVHTRGGEARKVRLGPKTRLVLVVPATLADVKPGAFIGVAAMPGENGEQKAMDVHIFPESMRGAGEGFRPYDLTPGSTMTNGNVNARVDSVSGPKLTVSYRGGQQTIVVDPKTPIVAFEPGSREALKPGAAILARGPVEDDGSIDAAFVLIGKNGLVPPL